MRKRWPITVSDIVGWEVSIVRNARTVLSSPGLRGLHWQSGSLQPVAPRLFERPAEWLLQPLKLERAREIGVAGQTGLRNARAPHTVLLVHLSLWQGSSPVIACVRVSPVLCCDVRPCRDLEAILGERWLDMKIEFVTFAKEGSQFRVIVKATIPHQLTRWTLISRSLVPVFPAA